jgi:hypothetical protein
MPASVGLIKKCAGQLKSYESTGGEGVVNGNLGLQKTQKILLGVALGGKNNRK